MIKLKIIFLIILFFTISGCKKVIKNAIQESGSETIEKVAKVGTEELLEKKIKSSTKKKIREIFPDDGTLNKAVTFDNLNAVEIVGTTIITSVKNNLDVLIKSFKLKVPLTVIDKVINGKHIKGVIANFDSHTLSSVKLAKSSYLLPDVEQFKQARKLLKDQFELDPEVFKRNLKKVNARMQKNDDEIFNLVEKEFRYAEKKMLDALNIEDAVKKNEEVLKWDKFRKNLTKDIVNIQVIKGKPFKKLTPEEMLDRQMKEITNTNVKAKGNLYGFQWHHSEKDGIMQAVAMDVHSLGDNSHIGGRQIWGGGTQYRKRKTSPLYND